MRRSISTGYWVSIVTEDWRWRMLTPPKGDYASVPLNDEGRRVADTWDLAQGRRGGAVVQAVRRRQHHAHARPPAHHLAGRQHAEARVRRRHADASAALRHGAGGRAKRRQDVAGLFGRRVGDRRADGRASIATAFRSAPAAAGRRRRRRRPRRRSRRRRGGSLRRDDDELSRRATCARTACPTARTRRSPSTSTRSVPSRTATSSCWCEPSSTIRSICRCRSSRARTSSWRKTGRSGIRRPARSIRRSMPAK